MEWWKKAAIYQIYPKSFMDSNNDGIGDIKGIISKLDYLKDLGINAIWICPVFDSPQDDNGYDISDYRKIWHKYGSNEDMYKLIDEAHKRNIKIIMDLVPNHSSDEHFWFKESKKSKDNQYRDYYYWRDEKNNWGSFFSGSAWEYDENTKQYYLHYFSKKQPDLNWENQKVRKEIYDIMRFWMDKGVDGWRIDVITAISKYTDFPDYDEKYGKNYVGHYHNNGPRMHEFIKEMHEEVFSKYDCVTVGEAPGSEPETAILLCGYDRKELNMIFTFDHMHLDTKRDSKIGKWDIEEFEMIKLKKTLNEWQISLMNKAWNALYFENHDQARTVSRWGNDREYRVECAKMFASILHCMQGTVFIYQGEEIGMVNARYDIEEYNDLEILNAYKDLVIDRKLLAKEKFMEAVYKIGRDNARTPMQWDSSKNAGFSMTEPWLKVNPRYKEINVKQALEDKNSIFYHYKKLIKLRQNDDNISLGNFEIIDMENKQIFAYERKYKDKSLIMLANFSENNISYNLDRQYNLDDYQVTLSNYDDIKKENNKLNLRSYETIVFTNYEVNI